MNRNERITLREVATPEEYQAFIALEKATWGEQFDELVPPHILMIAQKLGGIAAGAFNAAGEMLGLLFGLTGSKDGKLVHWSDLLAIKPEIRDHGIGWRLKCYQREQCLQRGIDTVYWTFDPLESRNAHFNLNKLGAGIDAYVPEMYLHNRGDLHRGLAMDRFVVAWHIRTAHVAAAIAGTPPARPAGWQRAPIVNEPVASGRQPKPGAWRRLTGSPLRVAIPAEIQAIKQQSMETARAWRDSTRAAFTYYLGAGYRVAGFFRDTDGPLAYYLLSHNDEEHHADNPQH